MLYSYKIFNLANPSLSPSLILTKYSLYAQIKIFWAVVKVYGYRNIKIATEDEIYDIVFYYKEHKIIGITVDSDNTSAELPPQLKAGVA